MSALSLCHCCDGGGGAGEDSDGAVLSVVDLPYLGYSLGMGPKTQAFPKSPGLQEFRCHGEDPLSLCPLNPHLGCGSWESSLEKYNLASQKSGEPVLCVTMCLTSLPLQASVSPSAKWERSFEFVVADQSLFQC